MFSETPICVYASYSSVQPWRFAAKTSFPNVPTARDSPRLRLIPPSLLASLLLPRFLPSTHLFPFTPCPLPLAGHSPPDQSPVHLPPPVACFPQTRCLMPTLFLTSRVPRPVPSYERPKLRETTVQRFRSQSDWLARTHCHF